jgi:exopolyphosphatase/guanosine-5'-triphosphate,3'-diphosphate pyrophosphatase
MERFEVNVLQVHNRGVRDGLVLQMIQELLGTASATTQQDRAAAVERLASASGGELAHGRHVARMAGLIYSQMIEDFGLIPEDRELLEAAARLQDVGYLINYDQHHKHSYHLIRHSRLEGFQAHELDLIANVARYHRGAKPKRKHANFRQLSQEDQQRVRHMAAILRVAGGLDRSNTQQIDGLGVHHEDGETEILVICPRYPELDIWGARRRVELFEDVFDTKLKITWQEPAIDGNHSINGADASRESALKEES